ncbi:MAG: sulfatase [Actinomycetota bacterium]
MRRLALFALPALLLSSLLAASGPAAGAGAGSGITNRPSDRPNFVVIMTDDQRMETLAKMPQTEKLLAAKGTTFNNSFVVNPECCPSRAATLTGDYSHNNGVYRDQPPHGGVASFVKHHDERSTIATWLDGAGYTTALMGKYLNGYKGTRIPQGWDSWTAFNVPHSGTGHYFNYTLNIDGDLKNYGQRPKDYSTDVLARKASSFIGNTDNPLFLYWAPSAPHKPAVPAPKYKHAFSHLPKWRPESFNEKGIKDKPKWAQVPRLTKAEIHKDVDGTRLQQYRTLLSVDDAVGHIVGALRQAGTLDNTMIIFTSDNGFLWGEHRSTGKQTPWEESIRVPFILRFDPVTANTATTDDNLIANIDIAPTIAAAAGVNTPRVDGSNILDLYNGGTWRTQFLIEHMEGKYSPAPTYCALRNQTEMYAVYKTGDRELYDLTSDPLELHNLAKDPAYDQEINGHGGLNDQLRDLCQPPPPNWRGP